MSQCSSETVCLENIFTPGIHSLTEPSKTSGKDTEQLQNTGYYTKVTWITLGMESSISEEKMREICSSKDFFHAFEMCVYRMVL